jgi:hypothetical protein
MLSIARSARSGNQFPILYTHCCVLVWPILIGVSQCVGAAVGNAGTKCQANADDFDSYQAATFSPSIPYHQLELHVVKNGLLSIEGAHLGRNAFYHHCCFDVHDPKILENCTYNCQVT